MKNAGKLLSICSIGLLLSACAGLKKFPVDRIWEFDPKFAVCAEYRIVDFENFKYEWIRDLPMAECPALFGFKAAQVPQVLDWAKDAIKYSKEKCR